YDETGEVTKIRFVEMRQEIRLHDVEVILFAAGQDFRDVNQHQSRLLICAQRFVDFRRAADGNRLLTLDVFLGASVQRGQLWIDGPSGGIQTREVRERRQNYK